MSAPRNCGPLRLLSVQAASAGRGSLAPATFERLLRLVFASKLSAQGFRLAWQSGEPLSLPVAQFAALLAVLERENVAGVPVEIDLHTDASGIDADWLDLFRRYHVNLQVRFDGPDGPYAAHARGACGRNASELTLRGIERLRAAHYPFGIVATLTREGLTHARDLLPYFARLGARSVGFVIAGPESDLPGVDGKMDRFWRGVAASARDLSDELPVREVGAALLRLAGDDKSLEDERVPLRIISCDWQGGLSTFSPELIGKVAPAYGDFVFATVGGLTRLEDMLASFTLRRCQAEIAAGVQACRQACAYFVACGGGTPAAKFDEHRHLRGAETLQCRQSIQAPMRLSLALAQASLATPPAWLSELPL